MKIYVDNRNVVMKEGYLTEHWGGKQWKIKNGGK